MCFYFYMTDAKSGKIPHTVTSVYQLLGGISDLAHVDIYIRMNISLSHVNTVCTSPLRMICSKH